MTTAPTPDQTRCPLCGGNNTCGIARGATTCWCFAVTLADGALDSVPPALRDRACLCERCARGDRPDPRSAAEGAGDRMAGDD